MSERTLLGFIANTCRKISDQIDSSIKKSEGGTVTLVTNEDVKAIIKDTITPAYIESLSATKKEPVVMNEDDGSCLVFANGTPIVVTDRTDGEIGSVITWDGGSVTVKKASIFGGCHDDDTPVASSIIVKGGTISNIFGGGMHKSHTLLAEVKVYGGKIDYIMGAGASSFDKICGCANGSNWYAGDPTGSPCVTDEARVFVYGGDVDLIYGGNEGIGYTKKVVVLIDNPTLDIRYVTAGGSNGGTEDAHVIIENVKKIDCIQGANRGFVKNVTIDIYGGSIIETAYAGAELPCTDTNATVNKAVLNIYKSGVNHGLTVMHAYKGGNNRKSMDEMEADDELNVGSVNFI